MHILWYRKNKNPPYSFIFIYNTDHIKFITFKNIWHILYILFAYVILRHLKKNIKALHRTARYILFLAEITNARYFLPFFFFFYQECLIQQTTTYLETFAILERLSLPWNPMMKIWYETPVVSNKNHWPLVSTDNRSGNSDVWEDLTCFCGCVALVAFLAPFSDTVSVPHRDFAAVTADMNRTRVSRSTVVSELSAC